MKCYYFCGARLVCTRFDCLSINLVCFLQVAKDRIDELEREVEVLKTQNAALRRGGAAHHNNTTLRGEGKSSENNNDDDAGDRGGGDGGHLLGGGTGPVDEARMMMHTKWENEKKLQKRITVLEKRLQDKIEECDDAQAQLAKLRETAQSALGAKDELSKKLGMVSKQQSENRKQSAGDVFALEEANARIFDLEELVVSLKRRTDVELSNEVRLV